MCSSQGHGCTRGYCRALVPTYGSAGHRSRTTNNLILKTCPPKNLITHHLGVVHFTVVQVKKKAAIWCQNVSHQLNTLTQVGNKIIPKTVIVGCALDGFRAIATPGKARPVSRFICDAAHPLAMLNLSGIEGWIDVNQVNGVAVVRFKECKIIRVMDADRTQLPTFFSVGSGFPFAFQNARTSARSASRMLGSAAESSCRSPESFFI